MRAFCDTRSDLQDWYCAQTLLVLTYISHSILSKSYSIFFSFFQIGINSLYAGLNNHYKAWSYQ